MVIFITVNSVRLPKSQWIIPYRVKCLAKKKKKMKNNNDVSNIVIECSADYG